MSRSVRTRAERSGHRFPSPLQPRTDCGGARMEGGVARAEATGGAAVPVLDPALEARGRLVRHAVATVLDALGEHVSVYQAHAQKWGEVAADPATAKLPVLPQAIRHAGQKLPATPPHLIPAHKAFVKTVDRLRKQFRGDAPKPAARRALTKRDSLSAAVRGCFRVLPSVRCLRLLTMLPTLVLPLFFGRVQSFAEPVPGWPVGQEALLTALAEWVRAEAADVRIATGRRSAVTDRSAWVCFDAGANHGVGWEVPPPTGYDTLAGPVGCSSTPFWAVVVMYVRVPDAEVAPSASARHDGGGGGHDLRNTRESAQRRTARTT